MKRIIDNKPLDSEGYGETLIMTFPELNQFAYDHKEMMGGQIEILRAFLEEKFYTGFDSVEELSNISILPDIRIERHELKNYLIVTVSILGFVGNVITANGIDGEGYVILEAIGEGEVKDGDSK